MCVPSLVWNHYTMYSSLSQVAMLISCHHTFLGIKFVENIESPTHI